MTRQFDFNGVTHEIELIFKDETFRQAIYRNEILTGYFISNYGRLFSTKRNRFLIPLENKPYYAYRTYLADKTISPYAHVLVAYAFVANENPDKNTVAHHIDGNPSNNKWDNLEWSSFKAIANSGAIKQRKAEKSFKPVMRMDKNRSIKFRYASVKAAVNQTQVSRKTIWKACRDGKLHCGFYWSFAS